MKSPIDELCEKWRTDVATKFGYGPIGQATLSHAGELAALNVTLIAYLEEGTLNSATPEDFHREYAKTPELYPNWFPVWTIKDKS